MSLLSKDHSDWVPCTGTVLSEHGTYWTNGDQAAGRPETARKYKLGVRAEPAGRAPFEATITMWLPIPRPENALVGQSVELIVHPDKDRAQARDEEAAITSPPAGTTVLGVQDLAAALASSAPPGPSNDTLDRLARLGELHAQGTLSDEEFAAQKALLLGE